MSDDPIRLDLSDDAPALAVEALRFARRDAPDAARLAAIEAAVLVKIAPPTGGGGGSGGSSLSPIAKVGAVAIATGAAVVAVVLATRTQPPSVAQEMAPEGVTASAPSTQLPSRTEPPTLSVDDLPAAPARPFASTRPAKASPSASAVVDPAESEQAEVALLDRAQSALSTRPADTLASCDEHARRFAAGTLVQEREVLAIDALVRLGRLADAESRAARFRETFPRSGHLRRVDALLAR